LLVGFVEEQFFEQDALKPLWELTVYYGFSHIEVECFEWLELFRPLTAGCRGFADR
jgi:hypothetical protein